MGEETDISIELATDIYVERLQAASRREALGTGPEILRPHGGTRTSGRAVGRGRRAAANTCRATGTCGPSSGKERAAPREAAQVRVDLGQGGAERGQSWCR